MASKARAQSCYLPARAAVAGQAKRALLEACKSRAEGPIRLYLHPRDARLLRLKALPLRGVERINALRSRLEASLLEDVDQLVIASCFEPQRWLAGFCHKKWIEALVHQAKALDIKLEGIWPAPCLYSDGPLFDQEGLDAMSEASNVQRAWPPETLPAFKVSDPHPGLNLLEALVLRSDNQAWSTLSSTTPHWFRALALRLAHARWALQHAPKGSLRRPAFYALLVFFTAASALQFDTWLLQGRVEQAEAELAQLFKETMPAQSVMVDPVIQLQRALDQRRQSPALGPASDAQLDPVAGLLLMQRALSRAGGVSAAEAVEMVEWTASAGLLTLRWKPMAIEQQSLRPIVQEIASKGGWSVQWGSPQESVMQWRALKGQGYAS